MKIYREYFARKLREALADKGKTQTALADDMSVEPPTISRWCNAKDFPEDDRLPVLTKSLGLRPDYFDVNAQDRVKSLKDAAEFFSMLSSTPPHIQRIVLMLVYKDAAYLEGLPEAVVRDATKLLKALVSR